MILRSTPTLVIYVVASL